MEEFAKPEAMRLAGMNENSTLCDMTQPTTKNECKLLTSSVTPLLFTEFKKQTNFLEILNSAFTADLAVY